MISIKGLNKADVLAVLYNASRPQGMGFLAFDPKPMAREQAQKILDSGQTDFDYLQGRVMKVDLSKDEFEPWGFDRDNGQGSAEKAIIVLRRSGKTNPATVQEIHRTGTLAAAEATKGMMGEATISDGRVIHLGLKEFSNVLPTQVNHAVKKVR